MRADVGVALWVHPGVHVAECRRFDSYVVKGPGPEDFDFFSSAIGKDGYGGFIIYCGCGICVRPANNCGFLPSWMRRARKGPRKRC